MMCYYLNIHFQAKGLIYLKSLLHFLLISSTWLRVSSLTDIKLNYFKNILYMKLMV